MTWRKATRDPGTWGNRNPQPKEKNMDARRRIAFILDDAIAKARNEGYAEGYEAADKLHAEGREARGEEALVVFTPKDRCESSCCETDGPPNAAQAAQEGITYYLDSKIVTKEVFDNRNRGLDNDEFTGYEGEDYTFGVGTEEGCTDCEHTEVIEEKFQPDDRYQDYNDAVWPGEE